ncbi:hypothetical protein [Microbacterium paraoxydans]|uniref:hypothetical protein n=1 Tax=Microbacterium paraoxydans TaxID=199592 RepID=UPI0021A300D7|nr:hypothetical protein [Microbacterium paraoxydans]MCT2222561.1 hypothetical protein [Microbacterium paraoxydans]
MTGPIARDDIRAVDCTLCELCWSVRAGQTLDQAVDGLSLHMSRTHGIARFEIEVVTDEGSVLTKTG